MSGISSLPLFIFSNRGQSKMHEGGPGFTTSQFRLSICWLCCVVLTQKGLKNFKVGKMRRKTTKKAGKFKNDSAFSLTLLTFIVMYVIAKLKMTLEWGVKSHLNFLLLGQDFMVLQKVSICRQMTLWRLKYNSTHLLQQHTTVLIRILPCSS